MASIIDKHARKIRLYRNGDVFHTGKKIIVSNYYRNFQQFLADCSADLNFVIGGVRRLYDMNGHRIRSLDELVDLGQYVATNGETFRSVDYPKESDLQPVFNGYSKENLNEWKDPKPMKRKPTNRSTGGLLMEETMQDNGSRIFNATSKAFRIAVFENGEPKCEGIKLILNHRNCKTFDQYLSSLKIIKNGQVRKIFDLPTGKRIRTLDDLHNGQNLVLSAFDPFKKLPYMAVDFSDKPKKEVEALRIVRFFPNGDSYHTGLTLTLIKKRYPTLQKLLESLNQQIELYTGKIQKIYTIDGKRVNAIEDLKDDHVLVANNDPFIKTTYNLMAIPPPEDKPGLNGATLHNEFISKIRPITQRRRNTLSGRRRDVPGTASSVVSKKRAVSATSTKHRDVVSRQQADEDLEPERQSEGAKPIMKPVKVKSKFVPLKGGDDGPGAKIMEPLSKPRTAAEKKAAESDQQKNRVSSPPTVTFVEEQKPKPKTAKSKQPSRMTSPEIPEDDNIKHKSGREEETFEKEKLQEMQSNRQKDLKVDSKSSKSLSKIPKLTSRSNSEESVDTTRSKPKSSSQSESKSKPNSGYKSKEPGLPPKSNPAIA